MDLNTTWFGNDDHFTNNGIIQSNGANNVSLNTSGLNQVIINNGTISSNGASSQTVLINNSGFTNNGTVTANGTNSVALETINSPEATNTGTITATGTNAVAVRLSQSNSTFTNSGAITASGGGTNAAIQSIGINNNIVLDTGTVVRGGISMGAGTGNTITYDVSGVGTGGGVIAVDQRLPATHTTNAINQSVPFPPARMWFRAEATWQSFPMPSSPPPRRPSRKRWMIPATSSRSASRSPCWAAA